MLCSFLHITPIPFPFPKKRAQPSRKGAGAERSGRWEGRTERGRRPQAAGRAQPPLRPAAERSGSTLLFRNKLPPLPSFRTKPGGSTYAPGPRQGGGAGAAPPLPMIPSHCHTSCIPNLPLFFVCVHCITALCAPIVPFAVPCHGAWREEAEDQRAQARREQRDTRGREEHTRTRE